MKQPKRFEDLKEKLKSGRTLTEKEEAFYNDFKHIYAHVPKQKEEALEEGLAFWEGENGFDELIKGNESNEVVVRCPHCGQRLMDAEYVVARIKCQRCKNYVIPSIENK